jgi:hypothetical protein
MNGNWGGDGKCLRPEQRRVPPTSVGYRERDNQVRRGKWGGGAFLAKGTYFHAREETFVDVKALICGAED